jgi:hypothetical protein
MIGVGLSIPEVATRVRAAVTPDAATTAAIAAMTVKPDASRTSLYDWLIKGLKTDGLWSKLDWLSMFAAHDEQAGRVNLKNPAQVASVVGAGLVFTVDRGHKGNGTDSYLDSGVLDTAAGNNSQDSSHLGVWVNVAEAAVTGGVIGTDAVLQHIIRLTAGGAGIFYRIHASTLAASFPTVPGIGSLIASRPDANNAVFYAGGVQAATVPAPSVAPTANTIRFLRANSILSDARVAAGCFGGALSASDAAALHARLSTYLTAIGAA